MKRAKFSPTIFQHFLTTELSHKARFAQLVRIYHQDYLALFPQTGDFRGRKTANFRGNHLQSSSKKLSGLP